MVGHCRCCCCCWNSWMGFISQISPDPTLPRTHPLYLSRIMVAHSISLAENETWWTVDQWNKSKTYLPPDSKAKRHGRNDPTKSLFILFFFLPQSIYAWYFTHIYHENQPNVGNTRHRWYGYSMKTSRSCLEGPNFWPVISPLSAPWMKRPITKRINTNPTSFIITLGFRPMIFSARRSAGTLQWKGEWTCFSQVFFWISK